MMHEDMKKVLAWSVTAIIGLFLSGNLYFIRHTLDRIDAMESVVWQLRQDSVLLRFTIDEMRKENKRRD